MIKDVYIYLFFRSISSSVIPLLLLVGLLIFMGQAKSDTLNKTEICILIPNTSIQYMKVVNIIKNSVKKNSNNKTVTTIVLSKHQKSQTINLDNKKLVVLVGSKSFDYYIKAKAKSPYITTLITRSAFDYFFSTTQTKHSFMGGVSIDQPSERFLSLAKALVPNLKKTALILGPEVIKRKKTILRGLNKYNLIEISRKDNPVYKLRKAYESNQALIIFPDRKKFNNSISRWVLTLSYQYKVPVISYSKKYAKAGALASLFSTSEQIGKQTAEMVISLLKNSNNASKKLVDPKYFDIFLNKSVGNALNLTIPSKLEIIKKLSN